MVITRSVKENNSRELKKHVSIIHCSNGLSLLQRKISNILLFHAYPFLQVQEEHKISIRELCDYLEYRGYNYDVIKQALKALISTIIEWNIVDDNLEEDWTASSILASVNIKGAVCSYAYSPRMKQLLYSPTMYGKIDLLVQSNFTSGYGLALYENCVRYRNLHRTKVFPLDVFRKIMGVSNEKYLIFRDLKKRVINKAVEEVNALSDLIVKPNINKVGQQIISIYFDISEKEKNIFSSSGNIDKAQLDDKPVKKHIDEYEVSAVTKKKLKDIYYLDIKAVEEMIKKYGIEKIEEKLGQIESTTSFITGKISNLAGFLIDALKKDYVPCKSNKIFMEEGRIKKDIECQEAKRREAERDIIIRKYEKYTDNQLNEFINNLDSKSLNELKVQFKQHLVKENAITVLNALKKNGFVNKVVRVFLKKFLGEFDSKYSLEFITFEQFQNIGSNKNEESPVAGQ